MPLSMRLIPLTLLSLAPMAHADLWQGPCVCQLAISATGHDFVGAVTSAVVRVDCPPSGGTSSFVIHARLTDLTTFHPKRDREMRERFDAEHHPEIRVAVTDLDWAAVAAATPMKPHLHPARLGFAGGECDLTLRLWPGSPDVPGQRVVHAETEVSQAALGLAPIRMLGLMLVHDEVGVKADLRLQPVTP
jgi:hypothetical protein